MKRITLIAVSLILCCVIFVSGYIQGYRNGRFSVCDSLKLTVAHDPASEDDTINLHVTVSYLP
jgi:hypothetical protein